ncbi:hypothetical protein BLNAU_25221 [Blattamonas nauphoetae]|uniref:Uncharacterized protein n=1 Tax=Blattamonas nauphoetae TaxID=2049346 RepID=A0ABQ9WKM3_9EUKA|nr:hypothetical protein BLNAU_25221 [Blattamonas nauphoetae]
MVLPESIKLSNLQGMNLPTSIEPDRNLRSFRTVSAFCWTTNTFHWPERFGFSRLSRSMLTTLSISFAATLTLLVNEENRELHGTSEHAEKVRKKKMQTVRCRSNLGNPFDRWHRARIHAPSFTEIGASRRVQKNPKTGLGCLDLRTGELRSEEEVLMGTTTDFVHTLFIMLAIPNASRLQVADSNASIVDSN